MKNKVLPIFIFLLTVAVGLPGNCHETSTYQLEKDILYRTGSDITAYMRERCVLDIYYPEGKKDFTTIVWFHGGGITGGNKHIPEEWKEKGFCVIAANYRLHPAAKHPEYIEDAAAAVAWAFKNISKYGGSPDRIIVSGHSAGGYLASMIGLDKSYLDAHQINADKIAALIPFSGHTITHFTIRKEMGYTETQPVTDKYAPLFHVRSDAPPLYLITGGREIEMLGRYEENAYLYRMMKVAGHQKTYLYEMDGFDHGGMAIPGYALTLRILKELKLN
jgi:acetyl esterase/lipase